MNYGLQTIIKSMDSLTINQGKQEKETESNRSVHVMMLAITSAKH